jgi:sortase A
VSQKIIFKICASIILFSGGVILFTTIYPIAAYEWTASQKYPVLISPLVDEKTGNFKFAKDSTKLSNWFDDKANRDFVTQNIKYFTISIPKLNIENATVAVGGDDLSESLIQYPGTAYPGKVGNSVIFGHSILPQFYNPKNYISIFSTLDTLDKKDEIFVDYDGITYRYEVESMFEVKPTDLQVLEQNTDSSYISLVTCSPPGHPLKPRRLIVRAKISLNTKQT